MITSLAFKGENDPSGVTAMWSIGRPVAEAIAVLECLQPEGQDLLRAPRLPGRRPSRLGERRPVISGHQHGGQRLRELGQQLLRPPAPPRLDPRPRGHPVEVHDPPIPSHAGLAHRAPSRRGHRGALQYRHQAIQLFHDYAGTSDNGFRAEVESEQAIARGEHLLALIGQHDHGPLTGPAADEALRRLELGEHQRLAGQVVTDLRRLQRLMKRHDPAIYPGKYVTCVYRHAKALCGGDSQPDLASCQPLRCRNVALTPANRDTLAEEIASLNAALTAVPALPPLPQHRLRDRRQVITDFLARNQSAEPARAAAILPPTRRAPGRLSPRCAPGQTPAPRESACSAWPAAWE
jgi:hypothetical protein